MLKNLADPGVRRLLNRVKQLVAFDGHIEVWADGLSFANASDGSLPIRLSASNILLRHSGIRSKLQFWLYTTGRVSTRLRYGPHKPPMTLIEAAKMPDRLTKPSPKRPTIRSPRNLPRSHRHGVPGATDLDTSPVSVRSVRTSNIYTSLTHRGCQWINLRVRSAAKSADFESKYCRQPVEQPEPGPPWRTSAGLPVGLPHVSQ